MSEEDEIRAQIKAAVHHTLEHYIGKPFNKEDVESAARTVQKELERAGVFDFDKHVSMTTEIDEKTRTVSTTLTSLTPYGGAIIEYLKYLSEPQ